MTYGMVASKSCLLTQISQRLQENTKKRYTVDRLARGIPQKALADYLHYVRGIVPSEPVIHIDDSDVIKLEGYHVTEACVLTDSNHPVSMFSELHSSTEKGFTSTNHITFAAME